MTTKPDNENRPPAGDTLFSILVWRLAMETRTFLGEQVHPELETQEPRLDYAAHSIDTLEMLKDRTEGHRSAAETEMLESILCQLRMDYVAARRRSEGKPDSPACGPQTAPPADAEPETPNQEKTHES